MEVILVILGIWLFFWLFGLVVNGFSRTAGAVKETVKGNGSFKSNMKLNFQGMSSFTARLTENRLTEEPSSPIVKKFECKGLFPVSPIKPSTKLGVIITVFDKSAGDLKPMVSMLEEFQEEGSVIFQIRKTIGEVTSTHGYLDWTTLGIVFPDFLVPPTSGKRKLELYVQLIDMNYHNLYKDLDVDKGRIVWDQSFDFEWDYSGVTGYEEASENREEATSLALKIGVAVAMADGSLDDSEGMVLRNWIIRHIGPYKGDKKQSLKDRYNSAMSSAFEDVKNNNLSLDQLSNRLNEIGEKANKYEALELAYDVMAADGVADSEELEVIKNIAHKLNLNMNEVNSLRDKKLVGLDSNSNKGASIEEILNISSDWSQEKIKTHLRAEFNKWNNRLNTLPEGNQRDNAQKMLDMISEARNKYG